MSGDDSDPCSDDIEEFEDSEDPGVLGDSDELDIGVELVDKDEFDFLDGVSELATLQSELFEVRGQLAVSRSNGVYVPLKLYRSHCHNSLRVSDLQSGLWCERQVEYRYLYPHMKRTEQWKRREREGKEIKKRTAVMVKGSTIHQMKELEVHERVVVKAVTHEDKQAIQLLNTYKQLSIVKQGKLEREISVFGDLFNTGILIVGIIDQLQYSAETQKLTITDLKTRRTNTLPGDSQILGNKLQVMLYKMLLDGLTRGCTNMSLLSDHINLNFSVMLSLSVIDYICELGLQSLLLSEDQALEITFGDLVQKVSKLIRGLDLPPVSSLMIYYEFQETNEVIGMEEVVFDEPWVTEMLKSAVGFWRGSREPSGPEIEDLWKCNTCQFKDVCVWRKHKTLESSPAAKGLNSPAGKGSPKTPCKFPALNSPGRGSTSCIPSKSMVPNYPGSPCRLALKSPVAMAPAGRASPSFKLPPVALAGRAKLPLKYPVAMVLNSPARRELNL